MIAGIDMGGTNIDGVIIRNGSLHKAVKHQVNHDDVLHSILACLQDLLRDVDEGNLERINLSTTVCTNAIVEDKVSQVGLILQQGPGLQWQFDRMGDYLRYLSGSVDHRGKLVRSIDKEELEQVRQEFSDSPIEAIAVVSKFSPRNPTVEEQVHQLFADAYEHITLGNSISGRLNFPRRVETSYLNAATYKTFNAFADHMRKALSEKQIKAPVYILKADGGTIDLEGAAAKPVETILSGPAASCMGMRALLSPDNSDSCLLDVGGTTTDIFFLVDGVPVFEPQGIEIDRRKTLVRAIYSVSIGLGGDSHVRFVEGDLQIGPERLGNAVAFGGEEITPTDALVYLGAMEGQYPDKSHQALKRVAGQEGIMPGELALTIVAKMCSMIKNRIGDSLRKINSSPVYTIKELLEDRVVKPGSIGIIGGSAKALAPYLEESLSLPVNCPEYFAVANAIGAALAKPTVEINLFADTEREIMSISELGVYEKIDKNFDLAEAKRIALAKTREAGRALGLDEIQSEAEIVEAGSFNMVHGYLGADKNIRVKAQIKPGLLTGDR
ncbi:MAG TPA: hydantoinase/oxoprolinase family protein [Clostridiaceae bacterium]|nr:hydantoinase/oxoprolinase family protein [Clostridiaceae bacterium]